MVHPAYIKPVSSLRPASSQRLLRCGSEDSFVVRKEQREQVLFLSNYCMHLRVHNYFLMLQVFHNYVHNNALFIHRWKKLNWQNLSCLRK